MAASIGAAGRRSSVISGAIGALLLSFVTANCSTGSAGDRQGARLELRLQSAQNADGEHFDFDAVEVTCDRHLTIHLGPSEEAPYLLDNWELRPPGNCEDHSHCGYVELELVYTDDRLKLSRASLAIVLSPHLITPELKQIKARLMDGRTGEMYLQDKLPVEDEVDIDLTFETCPDPGEGGAGAGGAGGMGGGSPGDAGGPNWGGAQG